MFLIFFKIFIKMIFLFLIVAVCQNINASTPTRFMSADYAFKFASKAWSRWDHKTVSLVKDDVKSDDNEPRYKLCRTMKDLPVEEQKDRGCDLLYAKKQKMSIAYGQINNEWGLPLNIWFAPGLFIIYFDQYFMKYISILFRRSIQ